MPVNVVEMIRSARAGAAAHGSSAAAAMKMKVPLDMNALLNETGGRMSRAVYESLFLTQTAYCTLSPRVWFEKKRRRRSRGRGEEGCRICLRFAAGLGPAAKPTHPS